MEYIHEYIDRGGLHQPYDIHTYEYISMAGEGGGIMQAAVI